MALDSTIILPSRIVSLGDMKRLKRELTDLNDYIKQINLRKPGTPIEHVPKTSRGLTEFSELNKFKLTDEKDRTKAIEVVNELINKAPVVNVGLAAEPSNLFVVKIANWFRSNINPLVLIQIGLEPTIAAGCTIRTLNRFYDFSLRKHFDSEHQLLLNKIKESADK